MRKQDVIRQLQLEAHVEGGYFRRTYCSPLTCQPPLADPTPGKQSGTDSGQTRACMSSIFYLLTDDRPTGHLHRNRSDIVHFYHGSLGHGSGGQGIGGQETGALRYTLIHPDGQVEEVVLGPDLNQGHRWQLTVPGGVWKASELLGGEWGLISEAVCPGFEYADMQLASLEDLQGLRPDDWRRYLHLIR